MTKFIFFSILIICSAKAAFAQNKYIVYFTDKGDELNYDPEKLLSRKTLEKRALFNIGLDDYDLPVNSDYLENLRVNNVEILSVSKWLNATLISTPLSIEQLYQLDRNIKNITNINTYNAKNTISKFENQSQINSGIAISPLMKKVGIDYGKAKEQNLIFKINHLHEKGYLGDGITIAFLDVGYYGINTIPFFDSIFKKNKVIDTYDFWNKSKNVYIKAEHGTSCASEIIANKPGQFVGMAPNVNLMFYITDDYYSETHQDEFYYVKALERADSIGVDIISASISYSDFDSGQVSYTYANMNGKTAISTIGCNIASSKGIIIVNGLGNGGKLCAPSDAPGILAVGGAFLSTKYDDISSQGPSFDNRIKPDVAGITINVTSILSNGSIYKWPYGGTSSATPLIAGLAACLKQAHPTASSSKIIEAIKLSGNRANNPDSLTGYGVPNARIADSILNISSTVKELQVINNVLIFPNPFTEQINIRSNNTIGNIELLSAMGELLLKDNINSNFTTIGLSSLPKGVFYIKIVSTKGILFKKIIHQ